MTDYMPCGNTAAERLNDQKEAEREKKLEGFDQYFDEFINETITDLDNDYTKAALELCEDEFYQLITCGYVNAYRGNIDRVQCLASCATAFQKALEDALRDLTEEAKQIEYMEQ